jgi:hypothetical protein
MEVDKLLQHKVVSRISNDVTFVLNLDGINVILIFGDLFVIIYSHASMKALSHWSDDIF